MYSHVGNFPKDDPGIDYIAETRKTYSGRVIVGRDMMIITIGDDVTVNTERVE